MPETTRWSLQLGAGDGKCLTIIPRGTTLPAWRGVVVTTMYDDQPHIGLNIYLGERARSEENYLLSQIKLDGINRGPRGEARVYLTFYAYGSGIYEVGVRYKEGDAEQKLSIIPSVGLTRDQVDQIKEKIRSRSPADFHEVTTSSELPVIALPRA